MCHTPFSSDEMSVGFIYTFGVDQNRERESFYLARPTDVRRRAGWRVCMYEGVGGERRGSVGEGGGDKGEQRNEGRGG